MNITERFDQLATGDYFVRAGLYFRKTSATKADPADPMTGLLVDARTSPQTFKKGDTVTVVVADMTRDEERAWAVKRATSHLTGACETAAFELETFRKRLAEDPCDAFSNCDPAMEYAARLWVATALKAVMDDPERGFEVAVSVARQEALRGARYPSRSTSQSSNLMAQAKTAAFAEFLDRVGAWS